MTKKYEIVRQRHLRAFRDMFQCPDQDLTVVQIVDGFVDNKKHPYAAQFLFGCERDGKFMEHADERQMFMDLWLGRYPQHTKAIARHHKWHSKPQPGRQNFEVYDGEWFVITEPAATQFFESLLGE